MSCGVPLISDEVTVALVELYAARRGLNRNEALRRLVRTGLGLDPIGEWKDRRRDRGVIVAALRKIKHPRAVKDIPKEHEAIFSELKSKVGAIEARRLVIEHAGIAKKRAAGRVSIQQLR